MERAIAATALVVTLFLSGCAVDAGFPAVHDMPAPRADTTLTPDQVKQATDSLISERDHLQGGQPAQPVNASATPAPQQNATAPAAKPAAAAADDSTGATSVGAYAKP